VENSLQKMKWSLTWYATGIFSSFLLIIASLLLVVSYSRMSDMAYNNAAKNFESSVEEIHDSVGNSYNLIVNMFSYLSTSKSWSTLDHKNPNIAQFLDIVRYLEKDTLTNSIYFGYEDGALLAIHLAATDVRREFFSTPKNVRYVIDVIDPRQQRINRLQRIFIDPYFQQVGPILNERSSFNIFPRPWYRLGLNSNKLSIVPLYKDVSNENNVITLVQKHSINNTVIAADIDIEALNDSLKVSNLADDTIKILFDKKGQFLVQNVLNSTSSNQLEHSDVMNTSQEGQKLKRVLQVHAKNNDIFTFSFRNNDWFGSVKSIRLFQQTETQLLIAAPKSTILAPTRILLKENMIGLGFMVVMFLPLCWLFARKLTKPLRTLSSQIKRVGALDISNISPDESRIKEINDLQTSVVNMSQTLNDFLHLLSTLAHEQDLKTLLEKTCIKSSDILHSSSAFVYLESEKNNDTFKPEIFHAAKSLIRPRLSSLPTVNGQSEDSLSALLKLNSIQFADMPEDLKSALQIAKLHNTDNLYLLTIPLIDRNGILLGFIGFSYDRVLQGDQLKNTLSIAGALSKFIALSFEGHRLIEKQKDFLNSFIQIIAGAIDTKSPYTGAHCQRVPELTGMLAKEASNSKSKHFIDFKPTKSDWEQLDIAAWLHDCGKVTTPEYIIDKGTKLETISNRIHEVRMRFEVLLRDAEINALTRIADGEDPRKVNSQLTAERSEIEADFSFVAACNTGHQRMNNITESRLVRIAKRSWSRYLDDKLGLSKSELETKSKVVMNLPVREFILADKHEHLIAHTDNLFELEAHLRFKMQRPALRNNLGELHNLLIPFGTINAEERYIINHHVIQTISMLEQLPFPEHLNRVAEIAGSHHEQLNGQGYPRGQRGDEISIEARILTISDIFEALTARDKPYKPAKSLSQSIAILADMAERNEIDKHLFQLFLSSGIYLRYAEKYLSTDQIDDINIKQYLTHANPQKIKLASH